MVSMDMPMDMQNSPGNRTVGSFRRIHIIRDSLINSVSQNYKKKTYRCRLRNRIIIYILVELLHTLLLDFLSRLAFFPFKKFIDTKKYDDFMA